MITTHPAVCLKCDNIFSIPEERSQGVHLLYCVRCGRHKRIIPSDLQLHYNRYLSTLHTPTSTGKQKGKEPVKPLFSDEHLDLRKYAYMVEHLAGMCICGGVFRFSGKPRCPKCWSTALRKDLTKKPFDLQVITNMSPEMLLWTP